MCLCVKAYEVIYEPFYIYNQRDVWKISIG